jgi:hypothetical protein
MTEFKLKINYVERIKEYNGMEAIISAVHWTYICTKNTETTRDLRTVHGVTNLPLPNSESFVDVSSIDYFVLKSWLESILDFKELEDRLTFLLDVKMEPHPYHMIEGLNKLNQ